MTDAQWIWEFIKHVVLPGIGASITLTLLVWREARRGRRDIWAFMNNHYKKLAERVTRLEEHE